MSLSTLDLKVEYRSDDLNIVDTFYIPCLSESNKYYRAVGYFTSSSLSLAAKGLSVFVGNQGTMRLVASPEFAKEDIDAFLRGYEARENIIERALLRKIQGEIENYSNIERSRLDCLAWLIAEERLEIKIAIKADYHNPSDFGIYHEKIGVFFDNQGNAVAFTGSPNETSGGLVNNFESLDVFVSWDDPHARVELKVNNFERLWNNTTKSLKIFDFPEAAKRELLKFRSRHYPKSDPESSIFKIEEPQAKYVGIKNNKPNISDNIELRDYQHEAFNNWESNNYKGILSMATGTGKTITALSSLVFFYDKHNSVFGLVTCPYKHLVNQWVKEAKQFGFRPIIAYESHSSWQEAVNTAIIDFKLKAIDNVLIITTHSTFSQKAMQEVLKTVGGNSVIIADEMHHLGALNNREKLPLSFPYRLGLSATPERWLDEEGTQALEEYFGKVVYEFPLERAINEGYLTEYYYYPVIVELNEGERQGYFELTKKIGQLAAKGASFNDTNMKQLLLQRADLLNNAESKLDILSELISKMERVSNTLVYCTPSQLKQVTKLLGSEFGFRVSQFTYRESTNQRKELLDSFASGELQALVAIRCLDEGIDVPSTRVAFLLASSSNPREFIQRRGRILRKSKNKSFSEIYDLITISSNNLGQNYDGLDIFNIERKILKKELTRFSEFARTAKNGMAATREIIHLAEAYNILDY